MSETTTSSNFFDILIPIGIVIILLSVLFGSVYNIGEVGTQGNVRDVAALLKALIWLLFGMFLVFIGLLTNLKSSLEHKNSVN